MQRRWIPAASKRLSFGPTESKVLVTGSQTDQRRTGRRSLRLVENMSIDTAELLDIRYVNICLSYYDITVGELWLRYCSLGGSAREYEVNEYLHGTRSLSHFQRELLRMALSELKGDQPAADRWPWSEPGA